LLRIGKQIVEAVQLAAGIRELPARAHHAMEYRGVVLLERHQHFDDGVPRLRASGDDQISANFDVSAAALAAGVHDGVGASRFPNGREHPRIPDRDARRQAGHDKRYFLLRQAIRGHCGIDIHQDLEPLEESGGVELLDRAAARRFPQVQVEDGRQLLRRCERDELAAVVQPVVPDDGVQNLGPEQRHRARELRRLRNTSKDVVRLVVLRHGPVMILATRHKKQS